MITIMVTYMNPQTVKVLKQLEAAGTAPILLVLDALGEARLIDIHYEAIRMGFKVSPGVIDRRLDNLCELGWIKKAKGEERTYTLTEKGKKIAEALKLLIEKVEK
jgi:DNA-binding HxlR family transcriptional regulator